MLVKHYLVAVISLPAGVFNPYSGVKTSILILDKRLAKKTDAVLFVKIDNDGYHLGAQRRPIDKNDLPAAVRAVKAFLHHERHEKHEKEPKELNLGFAGCHVVEKARIGENGEWNLSGERYVIGAATTSKYDLVTLGSVCDLIGGGTPSKAEPDYWNGGTVKWISSKHINEQGNIIGYEQITEKAVAETATKIAPKDSVILITRVSVGKFAFADDDYAINQDLTAVVPKDENILSSLFLFLIASELAKIIEKNAQGIGVRGVTRNFLAKLTIPLPPLHVQKEIVAEIIEYQAKIEALKQQISEQEDKIKATINHVWGDSEEKADQIKENESITLLAGGSGRKLGDG